MSKRGPSLEDVCKLAAERGVGIRIFVQDQHVDNDPPMITIQVFSRDPSVEPRAFMSHLDDNEHTGEAIGIALMDYVNKVSGGPLLPPGQVIGIA